MKQALMIAGPNGAGKTTAAMTLLPKYLSILEFVNADDIARGLNPLQPEAQAVTAARIMLDRIATLTAQGKSFGFESTGAGLTHVQTLKKCAAAGYKTKLAFLWLPSADMAIKRVEQRVKSGGHSIPIDVIRRRYARGIHHLVHDYLPIVEHAIIYDHSNHINAHKDLKKIAEKRPHEPIHVYDAALWQMIEEQANGA